MRSLTKAGTIAATSLLLLGAGALPAAAAEAPSTGEAPASILDTSRCTSLSNGTLCVRIKDARSTVEVTYSKSAGGAVTARFGFNYQGTDYNDAGAFSINAGETKSYAWHNLNVLCNSVVGFLSVTGQGRFQTPAVSDC
ncbi:hypothetical protein ACFU7Z_30460 [Kitasatospora sp. NPDC057518]|uniref:hypothetical protein n=1 Tax=unclassified Kitasatospora TaxID=2633591 RepID=UPI0036A26F07